MRVNKRHNTDRTQFFLQFFFTLDTRLNAAHKRLGGNLGTLQLDDAPYARCPIIQRFSILHLSAPWGFTKLNLSKQLE